MKILITGACGFAGRHLTEYLLSGYEFQMKALPEHSNSAGVITSITGVDNSACPGPSFNTENTFNSLENNPDGLQNTITGSQISAGKRIDFISADLRDSEKMEGIIKDIMPDRIYNLAAQASVGNSWKEPVKTFEINVLAGINLLEAVRKYCPRCRVLFACTAEEYAPLKNNADIAILEDFAIGPCNPYAISKAAIDFFASTYQEAYDLPIYISRSFNHIGPGQSERFVTADFAKQIAEIESKKKAPEISVGNLAVFRDFLDVRDAVRAYCFIIEKGESGEPYNVCSGIKISISDILEMMISLSKVKDIKITVDSSKLRPVDLKSVYGDNTKIKNHTGWKPAYNIKQTLADTLDWWRERSKSN